MWVQSLNDLVVDETLNTTNQPKSRQVEKIDPCNCNFDGCLRVITYVHILFKSQYAWQVAFCVFPAVVKIK